MQNLFFYYMCYVDLLAGADILGAREAAGARVWPASAVPSAEFLLCITTSETNKKIEHPCCHFLQ